MFFCDSETWLFVERTGPFQWSLKIRLTVNKDVIKVCVAESKLAFLETRLFLLPPLSLEGIVDLKAKQPLPCSHSRDHWNAG